MKANPNIDELLCSFVDGELPARQQTELQRLVARDPEVGRRLRQLQNCRTLVSALPRAEAPGELLEQIKLAVERKTLLAEQPASGVSTAGVIHLMARRFLAAAAMIALLGVLGFVVYQIVAPVPDTGVQPPVADIRQTIGPARHAPRPWLPIPAYPDGWRFGPPPSHRRTRFSSERSSRTACRPWWRRTMRPVSEPISWSAAGRG